MADGEALLEQADKLMKRHRVFLAAGAQPPASPAPEAEDLPVLTDVVAAPTAPAAPLVSPEQAQALARELLFERLPGQRQALADELTAWLDAELPQVIMRVMDGITDQLVAQVTAEARAALLPHLQAVLEADPPPAADGG